MVTRVCAIWLAVLAALPFTAPFAAIDLSDLVGGGHAQHAIDTIAAPFALGAQDDNADDTAASGACFQRVHPVGHCVLAPVASPVSGDPFTSVAAIFDGVDSLPATHDASALTSSLRL